MMTVTPDRSSAIDMAARIHATGRDGQVDAIAFLAQRLILQHEVLGGVDARNLAAALLREADEGGIDEVVLAAAVCDRLDAGNAQRVHDALHPQIVPVSPVAKSAGWKRLIPWFLRNPGRRTRWPGRAVITMTAGDKRLARQRTIDVFKTLRRYVDPDKIHEEFARNEHFRSLFIGFVMIYADIEKLSEDLSTGKAKVTLTRIKACTVFVNCIKRLDAEGRRTAVSEKWLSDFGDITVDSAVCAMPGDQVDKLGLMLQAYFTSGFDLKNPDVSKIFFDAINTSKSQKARKAQ